MRNQSMSIGLLFLAVACKSEKAPPPGSASVTTPAAATSPVTPSAPSVARPQPTRVSIWHSYRARERDALEASVARLNAGGHAVAVDLLAVPFDALPDKITNAIPRGHGPDAFIFGHDRVGDWAHAKLIAPLDRFMTEALAKRFLRPTVDAFIFKSSLYGLPTAFKPLALIYNRALVKEPPPSTDKLIVVAKALSDKAAGRFGLAYENMSPFFHAPWMHGFGGAFLNEKNEPALDTPENAQALAFARDLDVVHNVVPREVSSTLVSHLFNSGKAAMVLQGPWFLGEIEGIDFGVAPIPGVSQTGKRAVSLFTSEGFIMSARARDAAATFKAIDLLTSDAEAVARAGAGRQPVANVGAYDDAKIKGDAVLMAFRAQLDSSQPTSGSPEMRFVWVPLQKALSKAIRGVAKPVDALKAAQIEALAAIKMATR